MSMLRSLVAAVSISPMLMFAAAGLAAAQVSQDPTRITGPLVHENLAVYFIHGRSAPGKVPLSLEEALARRVVQVRETGNVNQLEIENLGNEEVFIQSGDIVKGGQQDRTLMVSLVLPPKSGRVPIASFCVEQGRWSARGREDVKNFGTSTASVPSREMKLAMKAPKPAAPPVDPTITNRRPLGYAAETSVRQREVWDAVAKAQDKLSGNLGGRVNSGESASSLQLALENERLVGAQKAYVNALRKAGEADSDIVGYVFAVNGKLNSGDVYPSNALFRKMWSKLLNASVTEAISHRNEARAEVPTIEVVTAFLADGERGAANEKPLNAGVKLDTREGDNAYYFETARAGNWVHRNYLAK
jgi:ARG and Rhodanese-Phosphatase-superfamily-associated Protein domain